MGSTNLLHACKVPTNGGMTARRGRAGELRRQVCASSQSRCEHSHSPMASAAHTVQDMISQQESTAGSDERQVVSPALSMPRVVATLQLVLAARRSARNAQRLELATETREDL